MVINGDDSVKVYSGTFTFVVISITYMYSVIKASFAYENQEL